jgi:hypothetical protein
MRGGGILGVIVFVWLLIGVVAASISVTTSRAAKPICHSGQHVTVVAGPLNYAGVNPKVTNCVPQPVAHCT